MGEKAQENSVWDIQLHTPTEWELILKLDWGAIPKRLLKKRGNK